MYLKSLEVHGFKSFPDKTVLNFNPGATIIVGPNGSGKSNITDAMRWVLGELSSKNLRGNRMEDVIFAGTSGVRPMGYAEVSVTFDNSGKEKTVPGDYDEITVTRRYYRSGDSEYYINRKQVRLRDITELFMNTGIGKEGYSIIGQGKIAEIISKKSEDRRAVFEESAGITKYRYRKQESEKKLAETEANMQRVSDIQTEIESRLSPLERDAAKARRYLELYGEKKMLDVSLWLYDMKGTREELEKTESDARMSAHELEMAEDTMRTIDALIETADEKRRANREAYQRNVEEMNEKRKSSSKLENDVRLLENNVRHAEDAERAAGEKAEAAKASEKRERENLIARKAEAEKIKDDLRSSRENETVIAGKRETLLSDRAGHDERIEALFAKRQNIEAALSDDRVRLDVLKNAVSSDDEQKNELKEQIASYESELSSVEKDCDAQEKVVGSYAEKSEIEKRELERTLSELSELTEKRDGEKEELNESSASIEAMTERIGAMERMMEHFDGFNNSVRFVMKAASEGSLRGIHGPLSNLIKVDGEYALAVETAFGSALQNIVTEDEPAAKAAIFALKDASAGRATFYPLTTVKKRPRGQEVEAAAGAKGFIGFADELVSCDGKYREIVSSVVGRITVFDNLDNAADMARAGGWRVRAVTLDGQQINAGGSFTGGSAGRDSGMLTRSSKIESLKARLSEEKKKNGVLSASVAGLDGKISSLTAERLEREEKSRLLDSLSGVEKASLSELQAKREFISGVLEKLRDDLNGSDGSREKNEKEIEELERLIEEKKNEVDTINEERTELAGERGELDLLAEEAAEELSSAKIETARLEKDAETAENLIRSTEEAIAARAAEAEAAEAEAVRLRGEIRTAEEASKQLAEQSEQMDAETRALEEKGRRLDAEADEIERELTELRHREKEQTSKKEILFVANTKNENKLSRLRENIDKMTSRLWDEYELTFSSAAEFENEEGFERVDEKNRGKIRSRFTALRDEIKSLGAVNVGAIEEYASTKERYDGIKRQMDDLSASRAELGELIASIEEDMKKMFADAFDEINRGFSDVFRELFGGGHAELSLTDPDDVLNSGIEISAAPPGKTIKHLSLLSGGEQAFIAIALMFALIRFNPSPFCIFDEIESALDEVNVVRVANYVKKFSEKVQIIMITHRRGTMEIADTLYGVTMPKHGISKVFTLEVGDNANEKYIK
ncbi:MAG: chromosome segregation protein SMC [Clostridia bacterium]|nr:chromosome segregation protein SMC [Clostridia bacterium]